MQDGKENQKRLIHKTILIVVTGCFFFAIAGYFLLDEFFYWTRPRTPDVAAGRIFPTNVKTIHGVDVAYLTRGEILCYEYLMCLAPIFATTAYALNRRWGCFEPPGWN